MFSIPQYLLESSICLLIFYGFYHFVLKKETFFQLNRLYLLATPFLSLLIPYWNISLRSKEVASSAFEEVIYPAIQSAQQVQTVFWEQMREPTPIFSLSVSDVILTVYLLGVLLMSFKLLTSLWSLVRIIREGKRQKREGFTQVELQDTFPATSFFGYIFYNQQITDEQQLILEHEKVHIRQWHSLDVLAMELAVIIKWFNPLIYFFRNALKATHEFIADQYVITQKTNRTTYAYVLVNANQDIHTPLTNTFYSLTTERLKMMLQQPSKNWKAAKYVLVLPIVLILMSLFSFNLLEEFQPVKESLVQMDKAYISLEEKTLLTLSESPKSGQVPYQIQWGKYTFDCQTRMGIRRYCICENKFIAKADLKSMSRSGLIFLKDGKKVDLKNIQINSLDGAVYCEKEELMIFSDNQYKYDRKACIWNAFEEEDKGSISFQTDEFSSVKFRFGINSMLANQTIPSEGIIIGQTKIPINNFNNREATGLTYNEIIKLLQEPNKYIEYFNNQYPVKTIKFTLYEDGEHKNYHLDNKEEMALYEKKFKFENPKVIMYSSGPFDKDTINFFFSDAYLNPSKKAILHSHTWGAHKINYKNRYLALSKKELLNLLKQHTILTPSEKEIEGVENIDFSYRYRPDIQCEFIGFWDDMLKDPCFKEHISHLQNGDVLTFPNLKTRGELGLAYSTWVNVIIEEKNSQQEEILIQTTLQPGQQTFPSLFNANGKHWRIQNIPFAELVKILTQSRPGRLEIMGDNQPNLDIYFYSPNRQLSEEEIYEKIFDALKRQYHITLKTKYQEQNSWFLSEGDPAKLSQFTEEKIIPNLEYLNEQARKKGLNPVGPMNYNWFADRYLPMEYGIEVTDLTEFSGRYILPLKTTNLKSLQKQLKRDYGLTLKQQKRTIPMTVVHFE